VIDFQIYFLAGVGEKPESLKRSPFVEKLIARGYEVLLLNLPSDEMMMATLSNYACVHVGSCNQTDL
jgi:heat shock protein beta